MPKLILRCNYLKNAPPSHLANYMNYISTREGVEKIDNTCGLLPATVKQKELIADILLSKIALIQGVSDTRNNNAIKPVVRSFVR
jgi:hypothetical protein